MIKCTGSRVNTAYSSKTSEKLTIAMKDLALIQKQRFHKYEFVLKEDCISVREYTVRGNKQWTVLLQDLGHQTVTEKDSSHTGTALSLFLGLFSILFVVIMVIDHSKHVSTWLWIAISMLYALFSIFIFTTPVTNEIRLVGGNETLVLLSDKPSEIRVREFIDEIIGRSQKILLRKFGKIDPDLPEEVMLGQLQWLFESEVITREMFDLLKAEYFLLRGNPH